jgi:formate hydrogenlyase subunit 3/multisubunit Na+/H+ antiporter MnhD subunit
LAFTTSLYSFNYIYEENYKNKPLFIVLFNAFIASMMFVVFSSNGISFLIFWEIMSVLSFFLILFEYENQENKHAANIYIIMTHIGTFFIFLLFLFMYMKTGSFSFEVWKNANIQDFSVFIVFILTLLGFGMKAGIFPMHTWLPKAHPEAPSNVSALMSGVMIKTAVYMMIRFYFEFMKSYNYTYGFSLLIIGGLTLIFGVLNAGVQNDIKRLLAYSSMENIGLIIIVLGLSMIFKSQGLYILSAFALMALLFHVLNHSIFKGLLFMASGAISSKAHTKDMNNLGGLIKKMPVSSFIFLIGILSASTLPPFNGFASEWLIYQSLLLASSLKLEIVSVFAPILASIMALAGGFATMAFVKTYGVSFLGRPRSKNAQNAKEAPLSMIISMSILALLCLLLGIFSFIGLYPINEVVKEILHVSIYKNIIISYGLIVTLPNASFSAISPLALLIGGFVFGVLIYLFIKVFGNVKTRVFETFSCGLENNSDKAQYSSNGFSQPLRRIFSKMYIITEKLSNAEDKRKYFFPVKNYVFEVKDLFEHIYDILSNKLIEKISKLRTYIQVGVVQVYIAYIVGTLIILLIWVSWIYVKK